MKKRKFLKVSGIAAAGVVTIPLIQSCSTGSPSKDGASGAAEKVITEYQLPDLPYSYDALEPYIDKMTMEIHHGKHHAGYVRKLNAALKESPVENTGLSDLMSKIKEGDTAVRHNGGGNYNHTLFWESMKNGASSDQMSQNLKDAINSNFDSFENFKTKFGESAATLFGSGWAWLCMEKDDKKKLFLSTTENQDNPEMINIIDKSGIPLLGLDVWEHAYYLKYENDRKKYIDNFTKIIDWGKISDRFSA